MKQKRYFSLLLVFSMLLTLLAIPVATAETVSGNPTQNFSYVTYDEETNPEAMPDGPWDIGENADSVVYLSDIAWGNFQCTNANVPSRNAPYKGTANSGLALSQILKYEKGIGIHPAGNGKNNPGYLEIDISDYTGESASPKRDTLYAAVGLTNFDSKGVWFEIQGDRDGDGVFETVLACSDIIVLYNVGEFHVDISGVQKVKLLVAADSDYSSCASAWADLCIYQKDGNAVRPTHTPSKADGIRLDPAADAATVTDSEFTFQNGVEYSIIYSSLLDDRKNDGKVNFSLVNGAVSYGINYDREVDLAYDLQAALAAKGVSVTVKPDSATPTANEILVGFTNRVESSSYLKYLQENELLNAYGAVAIGGKIAVGGWSTAANIQGAKWLETSIGESLSLSLGSSSVFENNDWVKISAYETASGSLAGISECYFDELLYYYRDTTETEFLTYCNKLTANGYTEQTAYRNAMPSHQNGKDNIYRLYVNANTDRQIYLYYSPDEESARLIAGKASAVNYPVSANSETDIVPVSVTQIEQEFSTNSGGMGYVITLKDGSFFIIDSGSTGTGNLDHVRLWNLLNQLNIRPDGKIIIRGWFITHEHDDHIKMFREFCVAYGSGVTIDGFYECVVPVSVAYNSKNPSYFFEAAHGVKYALSCVNGDPKVYMLHTGMNFSLFGLDIEVLYTVEDLYPSTLHYFNNASTTLMLTVDDYRLLITGDICTDACNTILARYPESEIKCDMLQIAHHGNFGATKAFYRAADPTVTLWPCSEEGYSKFMDERGKTSYCEVDRFVMSNELHVEEHYTAGTVAKDPDNNLTVQLRLPYVPDSRGYLTVGTTPQYSPETPEVSMAVGTDYTLTVLESPASAPDLPYNSSGVTYLSDLPYTGTTSNNNYAPAKNAEYKQTADSGITSKSGLHFSKGFGTHPKAYNDAAPSYIEIDVSAFQINSFYAVLGLSGAASGANGIKGRVLADYGDGNGYVQLLETEEIKGTDMVEIHITRKLNGVKKLKLVTVPSGQENALCHTVWCNTLIYNAPALSAIQYREAAANCYDARMIFTLDELTWDTLTVEITRNGKTKAESITTVYETLRADYSSLGGNANATVDARDIGGKYLFVICIKDIPESSGELDFEIRMIAEENTVRFENSVEVIIEKD